MGARGKPSAASLTVVTAPVDSRPDPWPGLSDAESAYWQNIVSSLPAVWFRPSDLPLLAAYCKAAARHDAEVDSLLTEDSVVSTPTGGVAVNPRLRIVDMSIRQMASLAGKLRLCPSARYDEKKAHTLGKNQSPAARPWEFGKAAKP